MVRVPAGSVTLGLKRGAGVFGWDNEFGEADARTCPRSRSIVTW